MFNIMYVPVFSVTTTKQSSRYETSLSPSFCHIGKWLVRNPINHDWALSLTFRNVVHSLISIRLSPRWLGTFLFCRNNKLQSPQRNICAQTGERDAPQNSDYVILFGRRSRRKMAVGIAVIQVFSSIFSQSLCPFYLVPLLSPIVFVVPNLGKRTNSPRANRKVFICRKGTIVLYFPFHLPLDLGQWHRHLCDHFT